MPPALRNVRVFFGAPSDLGAERRAFPAVLDEINRTKAHSLGVHLEPDGSDYAAPRPGRPQAVINERLDRSGIVVLCLGDRIGSPTGKGPSGFIEEFERAMKKKKDVRLFFKHVTARSFLSNDPQQVAALQFRSKVEEGKKILYSRFTSQRDFERKLRLTLAEWLDAGRPESSVVLRERELAELVNENDERGAILLPLSIAKTAALVLADEARNRMEAGQLERAEFLTQGALTLFPGPQSLHALQRLLFAQNLLDEADLVIDKLGELAKDTGDGAARLYYLEGKGRLAMRRGKLEEAANIYRESLKVATGLGEPSSQFVAEQILGRIALDSGDPATGLAHDERALQYARATHDAPSIASALNHLATDYHHAGRFQDSANMAKEAAEIARIHALPREEAIAMMHIALLIGPGPRYREAVGILEDAIKRARLTNDAYLEITLLTNLTSVALLKGDYDLAEKAGLEGLSVGGRLGDPERAYQPAYNLGQLYAITDKPQKAAEMMRRAADYLDRAGIRKKAEEARRRAIMYERGEKPVVDWNSEIQSAEPGAQPRSQK